jgi:NAD(P)-dependent dehydrogenase (short-subunit alcohol dehydrogenase family)
MLDSMISPEWQQSLIADTPLGRLGMPEDIADVVAFLVSNDARWITGEIIAATGGLYSKFGRSKCLNPGQGEGDNAFVLNP